MALEIENNLVAALGYAGATDVIFAQFGIASVAHPSPGVYTMTTLEALGDGEDVTTCVQEDATGGLINVVKIAPNQWTVRTYSNVGDLAERAWHVKIYRVATG